MLKKYGVITFILKYFTLKRPGVAGFADIIRTVTVFTKKSFKDSKKLKELEIMYRNAICICIF